MKILQLISVVAMMLSASVLYAAPMVPVDLDPIQHIDASLVVVDIDGTETAYTPAMIEEFPTYSLTTTTPWRDTPAIFEGALLSDILAKHGLDNIGAILVTAENEYVTTMNRDLLETVEILVATRVDGKAHSRRARGPIQFVIDADSFAASDLTSESNFVWMAARIEAEN